MRVPRLRPAVLVAALTAALTGVGGVAWSATREPAIRTTTPSSASQITNIDVLRQQIRNYYGDPLGTGTFAPDGNYAKEAGRVAADGSRWLDALARTPGRKAVVLDVDDTTLSTWNYEVASNWDYDKAENGEYVTGQRFPAVPGMVAMVQRAQKQGYAVFYLTGRGAAQEQATLGNLTRDGIGVDAGYPVPATLPDGEDGMFTKPAAGQGPDYLKQACAKDPGGACTTVHYKAATREQIEKQGYRIVGNFGDQDSDFSGGHALRTFRLPNPNYVVP
ncbi:HAD family acid phosphatase [Pseudonocardia phyllosphaerae]|uniref:HAD family acid phosphatase n=1 Tax=Pseudonocardia phyllosphaerae TaxID=3390502 RepID=UPI00397AAC65